MASEAPPRLWAIVGATGTGKTAYSLQLAEELADTTGRAAEIVNADAMQLYRGMDIGTAKLPVAQRRGIPHHLFAHLPPSAEAAVAEYQSVARATIAEIIARGKHPILVGGSGLYVSSVIYDFQFPPHDLAIRAALTEQLASEGIAPLLSELQTLAPQVAAAVDSRNPRRVLRALEVARLGGDAQVTLPVKPQLWHYGGAPTRIIGLHLSRAELVPRLDARVIEMWQAGLVAEAEKLLSAGITRSKTASRAIGYAQALAQLAGELSESEAIAATQALTRRYARRQHSWFKRYADVTWLHPRDAIKTHT